jgi:hypothetical protein
MENKPGGGSSGIGIAVGVLGVLGAIGVAAAAANGSKKPALRGAGTRRPLVKKPCGCGR